MEFEQCTLLSAVERRALQLFYNGTVYFYGCVCTSEFTLFPRLTFLSLAITRFKKSSARTEFVVVFLQILPENCLPNGLKIEFECEVHNVTRMLVSRNFLSLPISVSSVSLSMRTAQTARTQLSALKCWWGTNGFIIYLANLGFTLREITLNMVQDFLDRADYFCVRGSGVGNLPNTHSGETRDSRCFSHLSTILTQISNFISLLHVRFPGRFPNCRYSEEYGKRNA